MTKAEFLSELRTRLVELPQGDIDRSLDFYSEMIDDRMEDGMSEREAVANMGDLTRIADQIIAQVSSCEEIPEPVNEGVVSKSRYVLRNPWVVGFLSPFLLILWAVAISFLVSLWSVVVALYAVDLALGASGGALHVAGTALFCSGAIGEGVLVFGAGAFLIGFTVLWSLGCKYAAVGMTQATKWTFRGLVAMILRKESAA